jgi:hypothetical protein
VVTVMQTFHAKVTGWPLESPYMHHCLQAAAAVTLVLSASKALGIASSDLWLACNAARCDTPDGRLCSDSCRALIFPYPVITSQI